MPTPLRVPFHEKNQVKALGARWNADLKVWMAPDGANLEEFKQWLPKTNAINSNDLTSSQPRLTVPLLKNDKTQTLSTFMGKVSSVIQENFRAPQWVQVELSKINPRGRHIYLDLVEYNEAGKELAKARASLWDSRKEVLLTKFKKATGGELNDGMKLLLLLKADFSPQFGFSFSVEDIDPSYTLGDMQAKLKKIREDLIKDNLYGLNKQLHAPFDFTNVAVVSPEKAAGLADFTREADQLSEARLCSFKYYTATFQGQAAKASLLTAFENIKNDLAQERFDAIVVIRGGGAAADLAWLNDYDVAKALCLASRPVFTGIGHQIDDTILDEVSFRRFDTPSKVSAFIFSVIVNNANEAIANVTSISSNANKMIALAESNIERMVSSVTSESMRILDRYLLSLDSIMSTIKTAADNKISYVEQNMQSLMTQILGLSPKNTLSRGYAVVRNGNGKPISSVNAVKSGDEIQVEMKDGKIKATAN